MTDIRARRNHAEEKMERHKWRDREGGVGENRDGGIWRRTGKRKNNREEVRGGEERKSRFKSKRSRRE